MTLNRVQILEVLNRLFIWKYNSLAAYMFAAGPYVEQGQEMLFEEVQKVAREDREMSEAVAQTIEHYEGVPRIAPYDESVGHLNYLSLDYLAGVLAQKLEEQLTQLGEDRKLMDDSPEAREVITRIEEMTRSQVERLRDML